MKRKLMALNLALAALLAAVVYRFHEVDVAAREREARVLGARPIPKKYPPLPPAPVVAPVTAANYIDVAQRMLLSKDRNSEVIIDPDPPKPKPVMPALPVVEGLITIGEPGIIMTAKAGAGQRTYRKGDQVGDFKLLAFDTEKVLFDWNGEKVERKLDDLLEKVPPPAAGGLSTTAGAAPPPLPVAEVKGPGNDLGSGYRACLANDSTPAGTVRDGVKKIEITTPFGKSCRWEPAR